MGEKRVDSVVSSSLSCLAFFLWRCWNVETLWTILRQASLSDAAFLQVVMSMLKSLRQALRESL